MLGQKQLHAEALLKRPANYSEALHLYTLNKQEDIIKTITVIFGTKNIKKIMRRRPTRKQSPVKKILAITAIPAVFYLSGSLVIYKTLRLAGISPQWRDFSFLHSINQGLSLFTGGFTQSLWFASVFILIALPFAFIRLRFFTAITAFFILFLGFAFFTSGKVAAKNIAGAETVRFDFDSLSKVSPDIKRYNQKNELRLLLINSHDYVVLHSTNGILKSPFEFFRIPDDRVASLIIENNSR